MNGVAASGLQWTQDGSNVDDDAPAGGQVTATSLPLLNDPRNPVPHVERWNEAVTDRVTIRLICQPGHREGGDGDGDAARCGHDRAQVQHVQDRVGRSGFLSPDMYSRVYLHNGDSIPLRFRKPLWDCRRAHNAGGHDPPVGIAAGKRLTVSLDELRRPFPP